MDTTKKDLPSPQKQPSDVSEVKSPVDVADKVFNAISQTRSLERSTQEQVGKHLLEQNEQQIHDGKNESKTLPQIKLIDMKKERLDVQTKAEIKTKVNDESSESEGISPLKGEKVPVETPAPMLSAFNFNRTLMSFCMQQFFSDIQVLGRHNVPKTGPIILCGNHSNQFVDGCILLHCAGVVGRDARFMVAAKSMKHPVMGKLFRMAKAIPVHRASDSAKVGEGTLTFEDEFIVIGTDTKLTQTCKKGDSLKFLGKGEPKVEDQIIEEVVSDTKLILQKPGAKIHNPEEQYKYKILPKLDQTNVFEDCEKTLGGGGAVAIYPEGGSHDQTDFIPFKAGIAIATFGTIINTGQIPTIIPSGMKYFKRQEFRSKVIVEFGRPYRPSKKLIELYKSGEKRKAVARMLKDLTERMHEVVMTAPSWDELQAIYMARNLYLPTNIEGFTQEQENKIYQRFAIGYNKMKDDPELRQLVDAVTGYRQMLKLLNIEDSQVAFFKQSIKNQVYLLLISFVRMCLSLIFLLPGNIMIFPLQVSISFYTEQQRLNALMTSTVKVKANDVVSSTKILCYMVSFPIYLVVFTFLFDLLLRWYFQMEAAETVHFKKIFIFCFPIISLISIRSHIGAQTHHKEFQGRFLSLFYPGQADLIRNTRKVLKKRIRAVVDRVGPQVFKNFDKMRTVMFEPKTSLAKSTYTIREPLIDGNDDSITKKKSTPDKKKVQIDISETNSVNIGDDSISKRSVGRPPSETSRAETDYNLEYKDEIELNQAFNMFMDI